MTDWHQLVTTVAGKYEVDSEALLLHADDLLGLAVLKYDRLEAVVEEAAACLATGGLDGCRYCRG